MITHTIDITEFLMDGEYRKLEVNFVPDWGVDTMVKLCEGKFVTENTPMTRIAHSILSMGGPALTLSDGKNHPPVMIFDINKMTIGDISYQVNIFFDHIAEQAGDVKGLTNAIYSLYLGIIENLITKSKEL